MIRAIASIIVAYILMIVLIIAGFSVALMVMGVEACYKPGVWDVSNLWVIVSLAIGLVGAIAGGVICGLIAKSSTPPKVLAAFVLVLGLAAAAPAVFGAAESAATTRPAEVSPMEAAQHSKTPTFILLLNPFIGAVGVLIGAAMVKPKSAGRA